MNLWLSGEGDSLGELQWFWQLCFNSSFLAEHWNCLLPLSHFVWHWASQVTDTCSFILLLSLYFWVFFFNFVCGDLKLTGFKFLTWTSDFYCFGSHGVRPGARCASLEHGLEYSNCTMISSCIPLAQFAYPFLTTSAGGERAAPAKVAFLSLSWCLLLEFLSCLFCINMLSTCSCMDLYFVLSLVQCRFKDGSLQCVLLLRFLMKVCSVQVLILNTTVCLLHYFGDFLQSGEPFESPRKVESFVLLWSLILPI